MEEKTKQKWMTSYRIIVSIGMISLTVFTVMVGSLLVKREFFNRRSNTWCEKSEYSDLYQYEYTYNSVRLKELKTGLYLTPELSDVYDNNLTDSITVFFQNNKRGFLNIHTGKILIPAQYQFAWVFSEGLGAVVNEGKLGFVNAKGDLVIPNRYDYRNAAHDPMDFLFKGGSCAVIDPATGKSGLIDQKGEWKLQPQYDYIVNPIKGFRKVRLNEKFGLLDSALNLALPVQFMAIEFSDNGIVVDKGDVKQLIAYDCKTILEPVLYDTAYRLSYQTGNTDEYEEPVYISCDMICYEVSGGCGLMDMRGKVVTKPIYASIEGVSKDLFLCRLAKENYVVILNNKGQTIR